MSTPRSQLTRALLASLLLGMLAACSATGLAESWVDPGTKQLPHFQKIFVAYLGADAAAQRLAEDTLGTKIKSAEVAKAYVLFPDARKLDPASVREQVRAQGCDGALVMRLARVEQQISSSPAFPEYSSSFNRYWGYAAPAAVDVRTDEIVHVETNMYSLADGKLLYSARSETFNPQSTTTMVEEIAAAIARDLEKKGLRK
jgi:hypothetical protein